MPESIYGAHKDTLPKILDGLVIPVVEQQIHRKDQSDHGGNNVLSRARSNRYRIVCCFLNDVYDNIEFISSLPDVEIVNRKDYIRNSKPSGYRSYHLILRLTAPFEDEEGNNPGKFYVEVQLRTIAQDSWASLEHQMKYKKDIKNPEMITRELKRCADELASCDLSMQTIRNLIRQEH